MDLYPQFRQITDLPPTFLRNDQVFKQLMAAFSAALTLGTSANSALLANANYQNTDNGWIDVWGDLAGISRRFQESDNSFQPRLPDMLLAARDSAVAIELWLQIIESVIGTVVEKLPAWGYTVNLPASLSDTQAQQIINDLAYVRPAGMPFNVNISTGGTYLDTVNFFGPVQTTPGSGTIETVRAPWNFGGRVIGAWLTINSFNSQFGPQFGGPNLTFLGTVNYFGSSDYSVKRSTPVTLLQPWNFGGRVTGAWLASKKAASAFSIPCATNNQLSLLPDLIMVDPTMNAG